MVRDRIELARYFNKLGFTNGAEIGVADGRYSEILLKNIPNLILKMVDPWMPYEGNWRSSEYQQQAYEKACERVEDYKRGQVIRKTSIEASLDVSDACLDFVFIDGVHTFDYVMEDIIAWSRKVRKGGIVSGHDYYQFRESGVIQAVNAYVEEHKIDLNLTLYSEEDRHKDDRCPCWWFVKK